MNPNLSEPDTNTKWILFYNILGYRFYPIRTQTQMDIRMKQKKNQNPWK